MKEGDAVIGKESGNLYIITGFLECSASSICSLSMGSNRKKTQDPCFDCDGKRIICIIAKCGTNVHEDKFLTKGSICQKMVRLEENVPFSD